MSTAFHKLVETYSALHYTLPNTLPLNICTQMAIQGLRENFEVMELLKVQIKWCTKTGGSCSSASNQGFQ